MIKKELYLKNIGESLALLSKQVEIFNCVSFYDINIVSEDFYALLVNKIFGYELRNLNTYQKNAPAIDLVDDTRKLAFQVTSDNGSEKIKKTIGKFIEFDQYTKYDELYILLLVKKKKYTAQFDTQGLFVFNKDIHIIDYTDLMKELASKDTKTLDDINHFLETELVSKTQKIHGTQASEIGTIIDLIEFITKNREKKDRLEVVVDPEYKIERRFMEFAERLKRDFGILYSMYGDALEMVHATLEIDAAQDLITIMYLQDLSIKALHENSNDPIRAIDSIIEYFEHQLSHNGKKYDRAAIKFYLINEMIKCSVFPNQRSAYNADKQ